MVGEFHVELIDGGSGSIQVVGITQFWFPNEDWVGAADHQLKTMQQGGEDLYGSRLWTLDHLQTGTLR